MKFQILRDEKASKYVSGIAVHYYWDFIVPPSVLTWMHNLFPDRFLFASEASEGSKLYSIISIYIDYDG